MNVISKFQEYLLSLQKTSTYVEMGIELATRRRQTIFDSKKLKCLIDFVKVNIGDYAMKNSELRSIIINRFYYQSCAE